MKRTIWNPQGLTVRETSDRLHALLDQYDAGSIDSATLAEKLKELGLTPDLPMLYEQLRQMAARKIDPFNMRPRIDPEERARRDHADRIVAARDRLRGILIAAWTRAVIGAIWMVWFFVRGSPIYLVPAFGFFALSFYEDRRIQRARRDLAALQPSVARALTPTTAPK